MDALVKAETFDCYRTRLEIRMVQAEELKKVFPIQERVLQEKNEKADERWVGVV